MRLHEAAPKLIIQERVGDKMKFSLYCPVALLTRAGLALGRLHVTCYVSKLTNPLLPLPPLQLVSPCLRPAMFRSSPTCSSLFLSNRCHDGLESSSPLFSYVALNCT